ncbi:hypothetical protein QWZ06_10195 [Chryseobacterium tructae]|uniref:Uncharacterized protein n=1 Tax=Chryseobacterium tructae TaxID=1037380 RepID=A0ABV7XVP9_9FLAO|nr:hypothetical protein [Chryseobacterium tructae]MDN3692621.1 hypothetical protein [Chryseobacterium tructae]
MKQNKKYFFLALLLLLTCCDSHSNKDHLDSIDDFYEKCRKLTLSENKIGQEYQFSLIGGKIDEIHVKYLGNIITSKHDTLKIVNSQNLFGLSEQSKRGNGSVYIYDTQNKLIGIYFLGDYWGVPSKIEGQDLVFSYKNDFCNQTTKISLKDSIPKQIFIKCTKEGGDIYNLETAHN